MSTLGKGRYLDRWIARDGAWRIQARAYVSDLASVVRVGTHDLSSHLAAGTPGQPRHFGTRDRADPSWQLFTS